MEHHDDSEHSLAADLAAMLNLNSDRRQTLRWLLAGASALPIMGCGGGDSATATASNSLCTVSLLVFMQILPFSTGRRHSLVALC